MHGRMQSRLDRSTVNRVMATFQRMPGAITAGGGIVSVIGRVGAKIAGMDNGHCPVCGGISMEGSECSSDISNHSAQPSGVERERS
jgi:hypothetical protein